MDVGLVGDGPAVEAVRAALADDEASVEAVAVDALESVDLGVVVDTTGAAVFECASDIARENGVAWLAVELGGICGHAVPSAAIAGFAPETGCYMCLERRVEANVEDEADDDGEVDSTTARLAGALAGHEANRLCAGEPSRVLGGLLELPHAERRALPVPDCVCAKERDRALVREYEERDLEAVLGRAERALDERVGIIQEVGEAESFPTPYYLAHVSDTSGFSDATAAREAAGVDVDWDHAFVKALGEALERYSAGVYRTGEFEYASVEDLNDAIAPASFVLPEDVEMNGELPWVDGEDLVTGDSIQLPAEFVQFPPPEARHGPSITTGLGLGSSGVEALCSGLYEVIERDAAMLSWYSTFEPLGLTVEDEAFATLSRRARGEGLSVSAVLLTQDVDVPVVAVAVQRSEWPRFAVGSSANLDPIAAARSALTEALQSWMELRAMGPEEAAAAEGRIDRYAQGPGAAGEFFDVGQWIPAKRVGPADVPEGEAELDALVDKVENAELDVYAGRLTTRDLEALGFETVRVLVPAAQPLFTDEAYFGERAREVPRELGFEPRLDREFHPYP